MGKISENYEVPKVMQYVISEASWVDDNEWQQKKSTFR